MTQSTQLRSGETVLFEGDVTLVKSKLKVIPTAAIVTNQRLVVAAGDQIFEKTDIISAAEEKYGRARKMVFQLASGDSITLMAANEGSFKAAGLILTGQASMDSMPKGPELSEVKNGSAWLAAVGPLIASLVIGLLSVMIWGSPERWSGMVLFQIFMCRLTVIWLFLRIDYLMLQNQGFNVKKLGLADPITLPVYLFSRAKVFGHSKAYAITWCVLLGLDTLLLLG